MDIFPLGHSSFKIRGKQVTIVTDPYDLDTGLKFPKNIEADIITVSHGHPDHNYISAVGGKPFVVSGPGEYEIKEVSIIGVPTFHDEQNGKERGKNTVYHIRIDGLNIVHMGDIGHLLSSAQTEEIGDVDILLVPVGGVYSVDAEKALEIVADLEPKIVIPMHYNREGLDQKIFGTLTPVSAFLTKAGKEATVVPKLSVSKDKLPQEMQVVVLE